MNCDRFRDIYELYALGVLDGPEFDQFRSHLETGCLVCTKAVQGFTEFLPLLRYAVPQRDPPARAEERLQAVILGKSAVAAVSGFQLTGRPIPYRWLTTTALVLLLVGSGTGWWSWWTQRKGIVRLEQENKRLLVERQEIVKKPPQTAPQGPALLNEQEVEVLKQRLIALQQALDTANRIANDARRALDEKDAKISQLQNALRLRERDAKVAEARWDEKERSYRAALDEREAALGDKDKKLASYVNDIQLLNKQIDQYRNIVNSDRERLKGHERLVALLHSPSLKFVTLRGSERADKGVGHAFVSPESGLVFYAFNLPTLPRDRAYQLWLIRRRAPAIVSGGLFTPDAQGIAWLSFKERNLITDLTGIAVTDEPAGGSAFPTGHKFLIGTASYFAR